MRRRETNQGRVIQLVFLRSVNENEAHRICKNMGVLNLQSDARNSFFLSLKKGLTEQQIDSVIDGLESNPRIKSVFVIS